MGESRFARRVSVRSSCGEHSVRLDDGNALEGVEKVEVVILPDGVAKLVLTINEFRAEVQGVSPWPQSN